MKFFTEKPLIDFIEKHPQVRVVLQDWVDKIKKAEWEAVSDISNDFENVEFIGNSKVLFHLNTGNVELNVTIMLVGKFVYVRKLGVRSEE